LDDFESFIILVLIEEFILLNSTQEIKKNDNILIEFDRNNPPE
jgi:hypothetical protein